MKKLFQKMKEANRPTCAVIVAAAGSSVRMGGNKLFLPLADVPVLGRTLRAVDASDRVDEIVVATREEDIVAVSQLCRDLALRKPVKVVRGGASRAESVYLAALETAPEVGLIAVQDGDRPLVTTALIDTVIDKATKTAAAAPAVPVKDTIKTARDGVVTGTPERSGLYAVQTPQVFDAQLLRAALQAGLEAKAALTDDCSAVERLGKQVYLVDGDYDNIKITTPVDLVLAEAILAEREG